MPKILSEEEKQLRKWKKDTTLDFVLQCKCGKVLEGLQMNKAIQCKCGRFVVFDYKIMKRNCRILHEREITRSKGNMERSG
jgi:hypothetical protein